MTAAFPRMSPMGLSGLLVSFADHLSEPANRAAIAFTGALSRATPDGVEEISTSLASVFIRFDPQHLTLDTLSQQITGLLGAQDWYQAPLPEGRSLWRIPTVFGTDAAPQLAEAAGLAGVSPEQAVAELSARPLRVLTLGFSPGQPYLGTLPDQWDLPRQSGLTRAVPTGALVVAVRQCVLFASPAPTGWRHVGQTAFRCFRPEADQPFALRAGDECLFTPVSAADLARLAAQDASGQGGAVAAPLP